MYVFIPFFTQVGLQLNLPVLVQALGFSIVASLVRAFCMMCGTYTGGIKAGMAPDKALRLWMGLIPQAGVALGLAGIVGQQFRDSFGPSFQSTVLGRKQMPFARSCSAIVDAHRS
jgi:Kef-type K+ transport system membrane component KefB